MALANITPADANPSRPPCARIFHFPIFLDRDLSDGVFFVCPFLSLSRSSPIRLAKPKGLDRAQHTHDRLRRAGLRYCVRGPGSKLPPTTD